MQYILRIGLTVLWIGLIGLSSAAHAQGKSEDFTQLSLEELLALEVIPVELLGTHVHEAGEWMIGYRASRIEMIPHGDAHEANYDEDQESGHGRGHEDHSRYMMQPASMEMTMHMVSAMYGVTDRITLMVMAPYRSMQMENQLHHGGSINAASEGIGDVKIMGHYAFYTQGADFLIGKVGFSLPTGSVGVQGRTPEGASQRLPYAMQPGAGTPGYVSELTYIDQRYNWAWGIHATAVGWFGRNAHAWRPGVQYHTGGWITRRLTDWMAPLLHVDIHREADIVGADPKLDPSMTPAADPEKYSELHVSLEPGLSFYIPGGVLKGQRLSIESPIVVYDRHSGMLLEHAWHALVRWQWAF